MTSKDHGLRAEKYRAGAKNQDAGFPSILNIPYSNPYFLSLLLIIFFSFGCATYKGKFKEPAKQKKEYTSQTAAKEGLPQDYRAYYHYLMGLINELHNNIEPAITEYQKAKQIGRASCRERV